MSKSIRPNLTVLVVLVSAVSVVGAAGDREMEVAFEHDGDPVYRVLPPGRIPAIEEPRFVGGEAADDQMKQEEPVFGLVVGDEARAYSLWQLDRHEIVNDRFGGTAFAATW
jgi:hypothetical protein